MIAIGSIPIPFPFSPLPRKHLLPPPHYQPHQQPTTNNPRHNNANGYEPQLKIIEQQLILLPNVYRTTRIKGEHTVNLAHETITFINNQQYDYTYTWADYPCEGCQC